MPLPPPSSNVSWRDYSINTPTFRLTPIHKPDMSRFLVHMTGKNELLGILEGNEEAPASLMDGLGHLKANIPLYGPEARFHARVVCFTESPTFALDFFRYRSFDRWSRDQRFGIGFDKWRMVKRGVRPVMYADDRLIRTINSLYHAIAEAEGEVCKDASMNDKLTQMLNQLYPLLFPLLETRDLQGFMWEREWRYPDPEGLVFNYEDIEIICCPPNEEEELRDVLGMAVEHINFVRTWREYDDVTDYLRHQEDVWRQKEQYTEPEKVTKEELLQLRALERQYEIAIHSLESYDEFIERLSDDRAQLAQQLEVLNQEKAEVEEVIQKAEAEIQRDKAREDAKRKPSSWQ